MEVDKTTLKDLGIFVAEEDVSVFDKLNLSSTLRGQQQFEKNLRHTFTTIADILKVHDAVKAVDNALPQWPAQISNGTLMVVERFFDSRIDPLPSNPTLIPALAYKFLHNHDYALVKYSMRHFFDFITGMHFLSELLSTSKSVHINEVMTEVHKITAHAGLRKVHQYKRLGDMPLTTLMQFAYFIQRRYRSNILRMVQLYAKLDAWAGMAKAMTECNLVFPEFLESPDPFVEANEMFHLLLQEPVAYDLSLQKDHNFLFLTGANMAGKSTFIKAAGAAVYLAHTGMGVPAKKMKLSLFDGLLSNINVIDNIAKGESYFFNEVQRIKSTINKINDGRKWLILIDELFKGTNVEDAMKCSTTVIEGLLKKQNALFILSTHLYEIGNELKKHPNMIFSFFETKVDDEKLNFSYRLQPGISNDRLGYLILKKEGVVQLLQDM